MSPGSAESGCAMATCRTRGALRAAANAARHDRPVRGRRQHQSRAALRRLGSAARHQPDRDRRAGRGAAICRPQHGDDGRRGRQDQDAGPARRVDAGGLDGRARWSPAHRSDAARGGLSSCRSAPPRVTAWHWRSAFWPASSTARPGRGRFHRRAPPIPAQLVAATRVAAFASLNCSDASAPLPGRCEFQASGARRPARHASTRACPCIATSGTSSHHWR